MTMKLLFATLLSSFATMAVANDNPVTNPDVYQDGATLQAAWNMDNPNIQYNPNLNQYSLSFTTTDHFKQFQSNIHLNEEFYDTNCKTGDDATEYVVSDGIFDVALGEWTQGTQMTGGGETDGAPTGMGGDGAPSFDGLRRLDDAPDPETIQNVVSGYIHLDFKIDPAKLTKDNKLYTAGDGSGVLNMCVRVSVGFGGTDDATLNLQEQIDDGYKEVNFIETLLQIEYDLTGNFNVLAVNVAPKEKASDTQTEDAYGLTAYLCDTAVTETQPFAGGATKTVPKVKTQGTGDDFNQGALITICVRPTNDAYLEGVVMDYIDNFKWERKGAGTPIDVEQDAIVGGAAADNLLTYYSCTSGDAFCSFSSILFADFYITDGQATGSGGARTKFEGTRRLNENDEGRALQEAEGESPFDIAVAVQATDEGPGALKTAGGVSLGFTALASAMALVSSMLLA